MVQLSMFRPVSTLLLGVWCLTSCGGLPKKNIEQTLVVSRSEPVKKFSKTSFPRYQTADFLTFSELKRLVKEPEPGGELEEKVQRLLNRPIISNEAYYQGKRPARAQNPHMGDYLRVATWNVEKSIRMKEVTEMLSSEESFQKMLAEKGLATGSAGYEKLKRERERLASADVILLQEMDIGITRSGYRDVVRDLAKAMGMNYAFGPQQLEIDPVMLGLESISDGRGGQVKHQPDEDRYKGVFGVAILSRYPIKSAQSFQLKSQPYNWHSGEKASMDVMEGARRLATEIVFENQIVREMKIGGRGFFSVDLDVPGMPGDTLTVVNNHLEIKARPRDREAQMVEILSYIKNIPHAVVMAGDHNSAHEDLSPTSVTRVFSRMSSNPQTWLGVSMNILMATPIAVNSGRVLLNTAKNFHSPMAPHLPVIFPNKTRGIFVRVKEFRFDDGGKFDFRGDKDRSINRSSAKLANSNEKAIKGQTPTFSVQRPIGPIGRSRLDWMFVKAPPSAQESDDKEYRLAPHFGETLTGLVQDLPVRLSDHSPCVLDIPFDQPPGI